MRWDDLDEDRILVRDMKHPGDKKDNNVCCELPTYVAAVVAAAVEGMRPQPGAIPFSVSSFTTLAFLERCVSPMPRNTFGALEN